ncbi:hypothetical protein VKT23_014773 [Stygiomarasmius scandens]|uniref:Uncharacterized protein n=1 Tax=Marasmiellus scandens TaxID=2682957 RepID=A0ABR1IZZ9_9AGAR
MSGTNKPQKNWVKKMLAPFSGRKHKKNSANIAAGASQPNLMIGGRGFPAESRASSSGVSTTSEPIQVPRDQMIGQVQTQDQGILIAGSPDIAAATTVSALGYTAVIGVPAQPRIAGQASGQTVEAQASAAAEDQVMQPDYNYFKLTGAVLEKSVYTLKNFSELIPVPGLGPAVNAVCACIEHYHKVSKNKKKLEEFVDVLAVKSMSLEKEMKRDNSYQLNSHFEVLAG